MTVGSRGSAVVELQKNLTQLGYDTKGTDGIFGEDTKVAVMAFQEANGLTADGIVGSETQNAIENALAETVVYTVTQTLGREELAVGSRGSEVTELQKNLTQLGYDTKGTDGIFGENTKNAVMAFQKDHNLEVTGTVGNETIKAISLALARNGIKPDEPTEPAQPTEPSESGIPQFLGHDDLGYLSAKYEALHDCGAISSGKGDPGGKSYGLYQFAYNEGTPQDFIKWLKNKDTEIYNVLNNAYNADGGCGTNFDNAWRSLAETYTYRFSELQYNYTKEKYYDSSVKKIMQNLNFDVTKRGYTLNAVIWSRGVQMGGCGIVFSRAVEGMDLSTATDEEIIRAIYKECSKVTSKAPNSYSIKIKAADGDQYGITGKYLYYFSKSDSETQASVYNRLSNTELNDALEMLKKFG